MEDNFIEAATAKAFITVVDNYSDQVREVILKDIFFNDIEKHYFIRGGEKR